MGRAHRLTALQVAKASVAGMLADGAGLWLRVTKTGSRSWIFRYTFDGRERWAGFGMWPDTTLEEARDQASTWRKLVRAGIDPLTQKHDEARQRKAQQAARVSFDESARDYIATHRNAWNNPKHVMQWENTLATYASPVIGKLDIQLIELGHVRKVLEPIWTSKTETAKRLRGRIEQILDAAIAAGLRPGPNPARWKGNLQHLLPSPSKVARRGHFAALPWPELPAFMVELRNQPGMAAKALEMAILCGSRSGEVRGALWGEFNLAEALWTLPADRMKGGREHRVPLSPAALRLLDAMQPEPRGPADLVFPAPRGKPLSDMTLTALLRRMDKPVTAHGFRSTFRTWAAEATDTPHEVAEQALAHVQADKVVAAYMRTDLFERRRRLMAQWADYCAGAA